MDLEASRLARVLGSIVVAVGLVLSVPAHAELVYEIYAGNRPAGADRYMVPIREVMRELGIGGPHEIASGFTAAPRPSIVDPKVAAAQIVDQIELGYRSVLQGRDFKAASQTLANALGLAHENPAVFLGDANLRTEMTRALVALGVSLNRTGEPAAAKEAFADLSRMLGGQPLHGYGLEAERLYDAVNAPLARGPRGKLSVAVNSADAQIYVDDDGTTRGNRFSADVIPGRHRFLIAGKDRSLAYEVTVEANKEIALDLDWEIEQALVVSDAWVGFRTRSPLDRSRGLTFAKGLLRRMPRSDRETTVIALGIEKVCDRPAITGVRYNFGPKQQQVNARVLLVGPRDEAKLRALARFLVRDEKSPDVVVGDQEIPCSGVARASSDSDDESLFEGKGAKPLPRETIEQDHSGGPMWPSYVSGVVGLAAIGTGAYLVSIDGKCHTFDEKMNICADSWDTKWGGWSTVGGGAAVVGFAVVWFFTHRDSSAPVTVSLTANGAGAFVSGHF